MRVRFVVPTSTSFAPDAAMMSGMRNSPPISISSPRDTSTCFPLASAASAQQQRRGAVVHDERVLGAGDRREHRLGARSSASRARRSRGRPPGRCSPRRARAAALDRALGQRRPPEVRVQDHPGRVDHRGEADRDARGAWRSPAPGSRRRSAVGSPCAPAPAARPRRARRVTACFSSGRPTVAAARAPGSERSNESTEGSERRASVMARSLSREAPARARMGGRGASVAG